MRGLDLVCFLISIQTIWAENYTVTSVVEYPYLIDNGDGTFSGYMVDLLNGLSKIDGFSYEITLTADGKYGTEENGKWTGMIGDLRDDDEDIDIAAAPIVISDERRSVVSFTRQFRTIGHRILIKKPVATFSSLKVLFQPFSLELWIMVIVICFIVSAMLFIINKFSPSEWGSLQPEDDPTNARESFAAKNVFLFVHVTLTWQGYKEVPRSPAGRILVTMWFSFVFFLIISYIANLTAFFLARDIDKPVIPFKTWEEMAAQSSVTYGFCKDCSIYRKMKASTDPTLQQITRNILSDYSTFDSYQEGIKKLRETDGNYALIVPSDVGAKLINLEPCDLMMTGAEVILLSHAMACKRTDVCNRLSFAIMKMENDGSLYELEQKWLIPKSVCPATNLNEYVSRHETSKITARPLSIADASLAFVVLLLGLVLSIIFLIIEILVHKRRKTKSSNINTNGNTNNMATGEDVEQARLPDEQEKAPIATNEA